jgi:CDP-glucose 4,6-dehydratase
MVVRYPNAVRPWQHVLDPLCGYLMLGQRLYNNGYRFSGGWNFGPDKKDARTVRWVIERFMKTWETNISWIYDKSDNFYEARHLQLDCSKAQKVLGWLPKWRLPVAIKKAVDWYKAYSYGYDMFNLTLDQIDSYERNLSNKSICENKR